MAWKDNAVGIVVDRTMNVDFAALKAQGLDYVVIDAGVAYDHSPAFNEQYTKAVAAGLPVMVQYTPISAIDDYVYLAPAREQIGQLQKLLGTKKIHGLIISMERWWIGWDQEQLRNPLRPAPSIAIADTAKEFAMTFTKQYAPLGVPVMIRTNDNFVQKYSPEMSAWLDLYPFYLADWRYRLRDAQGAYSVYKYAPAVSVTSLAEIALALPPEDAKNPLVPGHVPQLKFWECNGAVGVPLSLVKGWDNLNKAVKVVLFNGLDEVLKNYLKVTDAVNPGPIDPVTPPAPLGDLTKVEESLTSIVVLCEHIAADLTAIRSVFK